MNVSFGSKADICAANRHVRFTPNSGHVRATRDVRFVPEADIVSFDHLIGLCEQRGRDHYAERLGGLEIEHELVLSRCLHRLMCPLRTCCE